MTYNVFSGTLNPTHSLTHVLADISRSRYNTPSMDKMERHMQQARRCYRRRGQSVFAGMHSVCSVQWAWRITTNSPQIIRRLSGFLDAASRKP